MFLQTRQRSLIVAGDSATPSRHLLKMRFPSPTRT